MLVVSPICFGMMGIADVFVPLYYGNGFERCSEIYQFLLLSCIFLCFAQNIKTQYLIPENKERIFIFSTFYGAIVNVVLNLMLIPQYGAVGAAAGTLGAEIVVWAYQCINVYNCKKYERFM